ncbi:MAG: ribonuclease J [Firmicutes bacterium]|nr:ribonuclease J [Bacillota bacterium]
MAKNGEKLRVIPLGGLGEIGKNMMVLEYGNDLIVIDSGLEFPDDELLGIDLVIPDFSYLVENKNRLRAVVLTHGHEDHIGALPYVLKELRVPVYGTRLTLGLVKGKLEEFDLGYDPDFRVVKAGDKVPIGCFEVEFIHVNHSIADSVALGIKTPVGYVIHTGDYKIDQTPVDGEVMDLHTFAAYGHRGVLLLMSDSTNVERPGFTQSERSVGEAFEEAFERVRGRIIIASFASNVHRIQQIMDAAAHHRRKVAVVGRSVEKVVDIALELGYLRVPDHTLVDVDTIDHLPAHQVVIITTGTQGEPMSALSRIAMSEHKKVSILPGDTVIISANPIPGNERLVSRVVNHLFRQGAEVIYERFSGMHASGHASQEEQKLMLNLVRPRYFMPVHGEYRHLKRHALMAEELGIPSSNVFVMENGDVLELTSHSARLGERVNAGKVLVDGLGVGDVGNIVLRDRRLLAQDGILIVVVTINKQTGAVIAGPDIISRGFVYMREAESLVEEAKARVRQALGECEANQVTEWGSIKNSVRDALSTFIYDKIHRRPMILPIVMEV